MISPMEFIPIAERQRGVGIIPLGQFGWLHHALQPVHLVATAALA